MNKKNPTFWQKYNIQNFMWWRQLDFRQMRPGYLVKKTRHYDVVKFLEGYHNFDEKLLDLVKENGHHQVVKFLEDYYNGNYRNRNFEVKFLEA